jgi:hypothetical protein
LHKAGCGEFKQFVSWESFELITEGLCGGDNVRASPGFEAQCRDTAVFDRGEQLDAQALVIDIGLM